MTGPPAWIALAAALIVVGLCGLGLWWAERIDDARYRRYSQQAEAERERQDLTHFLTPEDRAWLAAQTKWSRGNP